MMEGLTVAEGAVMMVIVFVVATIVSTGAFAAITAVRAAWRWGVRSVGQRSGSKGIGERES